MKNQCIDVEELKRLQLEMLVEIDKYCHANDIQYSLAYGTLLGAVRHQGYIPWDDDIDIMMLRADYDKFISGFCAPNMEALSHQKSGSYFLPFAKVVRTDTVMEEEVSIKSDMGVYIDVFPIDTLPSRKVSRSFLLACKRILNSIYQFKVVRLSSHRSRLKNIILGAGKLLFKPITMHCLLVGMDRLSRAHAGKSSPYCGPIADVDKTSSRVFAKDLFASYTSLQFEDKRFKAISSYDTWLSQMYGNYMELPPIDKRVSHHLFKAYWK